MKLANLSVDRPLAITMLLVALVLLGLFSLPRLAVDLYPKMELPFVAIITSYEGAAPAEVEKLVTKPVESAVATVSNVNKIQSISQNGSSLVLIMFNWGTDVDDAVNDLREKVDQIKGMLPDGVQTPRTMKADPNSQPIISFAVTGGNEVKLKKIAEDTIKPRLERINGVASVTVKGGREREIKVILDKAKLDAYGLGVNQVIQGLSGGNISGTAGMVEKGASEMSLRVIGEYSSLEDLRSVRISLPTGTTVALRDLAVIEDSFKKEIQHAFVNGEPSLGLDIMKASDGNIVKVARQVHQEVEQLNKELPAETKIEVIIDQSKFINQSINNVIYHGMLGAFFAVAILYLFLRSVRSTLVVALVIPIAIIATFTMMYFSKQTINLLSLGGLVLGLGSLVDFSVVVLESIYRYRENGYGIIESAKLGSAEVGNAVMASAASQVVVFLPIVFVQGLASILFGPLALAVSFSHIAALFAALTLVPMLASKLLRNVPPPLEIKAPVKTKNPLLIFGRFINILTERYSKILKWSLSNRRKVVGLTIVPLVASIALTPLIGTEFIPGMDQGEVTVTLEMPAGTKLAETTHIARDLEHLIKYEIDEVEHVFTTVGTGAMAMLGLSSGDTATIQIKLKPQAEREITTQEAVEKLRLAMSNVPGAQITIGADNNRGGMTSSPVEVTIRGDDLQLLEELGDTVATIVANVEGTENVTNSLAEVSSEIQIVVDREKAARYGLTAGQVLSAVRLSYGGNIVSRMRTGDDEVNIRLLNSGNFEKTPDTLSGMMMVTPTGAQVPVGAIVSIETREVPQVINRSGQSRQVSITADVAGRDTGSVNKDVQAQLDGLTLPEGYLVETGGQAQDMADSFGSLGIALILSVILVFMVMVATFESLFQPFIIMFSLPPTFIGVVMGLLVTGHRLSVTALIGAIMLVGIVVNNAIVLVDYINTLRKRGYERNQAILEAGPVRLRPILMTALTTVLALLPMAFGGGEGAEAQAPMAVVVAFGLSLSTLVTLVFVPVVYTIFDDLGQTLTTKFGKLIVPKTKDA